MAWRESIPSAERALRLSRSRPLAALAWVAWAAGLLSSTVSCTKTEPAALEAPKKEPEEAKEKGLNLPFDGPCLQDSDCQKGLQCLSSRCLHQNEEWNSALRTYAARLASTTHAIALNPNGGGSDGFYKELFDRPEISDNWSCEYPLSCPHGQFCDQDHACVAWRRKGEECGRGRGAFTSADRHSCAPNLFCDERFRPPVCRLRYKEGDTPHKKDLRRDRNELRMSTRTGPTLIPKSGPTRATVEGA